MWKGTLEQASKYETEAYKFEDDLANIRPTSILGLDGSIQTEITKDTLMVSVDPDAERAFSDALIDAGLTMTIPKLNSETGLLDYILGGDVEALTEQEIKSLNTVLSKISFSGDKEAANS